MTTGDYIRKFRKEKGMPQKVLAEKIGISPSMLAQYEKGLRTPKFGRLCQIANALDIPVHELMNQKDTYALLDEDFIDIEQSGIMPEKIEILTEIAIKQISEYLNRLNWAGKEKALQEIRKIAENPKYQKSTSED